MEVKLSQKYFINPAFEYGIRSYNSYKAGEGYERIHTFEMYVIKALTIIYGEKAILLPYKIDNEKAFKCNLLIYDLKESDLKEFIKCMNSYYEFLLNYKNGVKVTGLITEIEKILLKMIMKRSKRKEFTPEEIRQFDMIFAPNEGDLKNLKSLVSSDQGLILRTWNDDKIQITNTQLGLMAVNPTLLHPSVYQKYGLDIRNIATLQENEIMEINRQINEEEMMKTTRLQNPFKRKKKFQMGVTSIVVLLSLAFTFVLVSVLFKII